MAFPSWLRELAGDVVAPRGCAACDAPTVRRAIFCWACAASVVPAQPDATVHAGAAYEGSVADAITRFKYGNRPDLGEPLAHLALRGFSRRLDLVMPVPLHVSRLIERGFNQAALLARPIARHLGGRLETRALTRRRATEHQAALDADARRNNVSGAFAAMRERIEGRSVVLVDDVCTTGSTLGAALQALQAAGAAEVVALVVARAELSSPCEPGRRP